MEGQGDGKVGFVDAASGNGGCIALEIGPGHVFGLIAERGYVGEMPGSGGGHAGRADKMIDHKHCLAKTPMGHKHGKAPGFQRVVDFRVARGRRGLRLLSSPFDFRFDWQIACFVPGFFTNCIADNFKGAGIACGGLRSGAAAMASAARQLSFRRRVSSAPARMPSCMETCF